jgi:hypothetical protein
MRDWDQKERPKPPTSAEPLETDAPGAEGGIWEQYGPAVLAVILVVVIAGICSSIVSLR